jgi:hypothetical protein
MLILFIINFEMKKMKLLLVFISIILIASCAPFIRYDACDNRWQKDPIWDRAYRPSNDTICFTDSKEQRMDGDFITILASALSSKNISCGQRTDQCTPGALNTFFFLSGYSDPMEIFKLLKIFSGHQEHAPTIDEVAYALKKGFMVMGRIKTDYYFNVIGVDIQKNELIIVDHRKNDKRVSMTLFKTESHLFFIVHDVGLNFLA